MTPTLRCLGVLRELQNSPNRESDDALILKAVVDQLEVMGVRAFAATPEEFDAVDVEPHEVLLPMCESYPRLKRLLALEAEHRVRFINPPSAVLNCYRTNMVPLLSECEGLRFPASELRRVEDGAGRPPAGFEAPEGWWIKRGDVHNTCDHDVIRVRAWSELERVLADFRGREITHFVAQPHIDGDLIKFYAVGPGRWFTWFYHDATRARRIPFELDDLASAAAAGAHALGLEVFGGDAIVSPGGLITLIDLNSWPSFARVRAEAAVQIAWHVRSAALRHQRNHSAPRGGRVAGGQLTRPPAGGE
ncbi:MAG: hypothetical protein HY554_06335 [Elusimicrobia bacterium]|nr:hypothetical protein [Elusimicrobiota bacterium]